MLTNFSLTAYPDTIAVNCAPAVTAQTFDAVTDTFSFIFRIPASGNIDNVHYRVSASTTPSLTLAVSVQTVDPATGKPTGTNYKGHTTVSSANPTTGNKVANVAIVGAVAGNEVAIVFALSAYTSGSIALQTNFGVGMSTQVRSAYPYQMSNTAAADVLAAWTGLGSVALEYAGALYYQIVALSGTGMLVGTTSSSVVTSAGTTRRANIVRPPVSCRCVGMWAQADVDGGVTFNLRDALTDTVLATATPDSDVRGLTTVDTYFYPWDAAATVNLTAGKDYYVTIEGTDVTGGTIYFIQNIPAVAQLDQISGGRNCYGFTYAGSWVAANTTRYMLGLILDQFDNGGYSRGRVVNA